MEVLGIAASLKHSPKIVGERDQKQWYVKYAVYPNHYNVKTGQPSLSLDGFKAQNTGSLNIFIPCKETFNRSICD